MSQVRVAPYGSWKSPITSDVVVEGAVGLSEILLDGGDVYWLETRPGDGPAAMEYPPRLRELVRTARRRHLEAVSKLVEHVSTTTTRTITRSSG